MENNKYIFNGHSDILSDVNLRRTKGEKDIFRKYHYKNFLESQVKSTILVLWVDPEHLDRQAERMNQLIISMLKEFQDASDIINIVRNFSDFDYNNEKINVLIGMEGLSHIGEDIDLLKYYYNEIGLRHASLTWNEKNLLASGVSDDFAGLTSLGEKAVSTIEDLGMLLDVSHLNEKSFWDVIHCAKGPVIASHSNAKKFADVKRNLDDKQLVAIAKSGGLVGLNAVSVFVNSDMDKQNLEDLVNQIDYLKDLIGIEHICFGFDFCDFLPEAYVGASDSRTNSITVKNLSSEADIKNLINLLIEKGYSDENIEKLAYNNYMRLLKKVLK